MSTNILPTSQTAAGAAAAQALAAAQAAQAASNASSSGTDPAATQNNFLKLLVTQLQNQDPLNPEDNSEITSQLAQLSTVTGVNQLNTTLTALQTSYQSSESLQATGLISHGVLAAGSTMQLATSTGTDSSGASTSTTAAVFGVNLGTAAADAKVKITDSSGKVVKTMDLGATTAGTQPLTWDGVEDDGTTVAPAGKYSFTVSAVDASGTALTDATTLTLGVVESVSSGSSGVKLNVSQPLGSINLSDVMQVL